MLDILYHYIQPDSLGDHLIIILFSHRPWIKTFVDDEPSAAMFFQGCLHYNCIVASNEHAVKLTLGKITKGVTFSVPNKKSFSSWNLAY